jgi:hypothetical protein
LPRAFLIFGGLRVRGIFGGWIGHDGTQVE